MNLRIKVLRGSECTVKIKPENTILELKYEIEKQLKIPAIHQKIVLMGRSLADENQIASYPISDNTRLTVVVKKPDPLKDIMFRSFRKCYNEQEAEILTSEFMKDFDRRIKEMSLDDIERLATGLLEHS
ncbi:ubiquitin-like protein 4A [Condylostylus longicornis]|uniref:ubiquitin-like protein 4A n=1 Tax=Condylostylus longicornis TaxID=2530218 RepID=UPI00244DEE9A|nr:ubiquitin-like protein 4A [Condylostylus longicornis]